MCLLEMMRTTRRYRVAPKFYFDVQGRLAQWHWARKPTKTESTSLTTTRKRVALQRTEQTRTRPMPTYKRRPQIKPSARHTSKPAGRRQQNTHQQNYPANRFIECIQKFCQNPCTSYPHTPHDTRPTNLAADPSNPQRCIRQTARVNLASCAATLSKPTDEFGKPHTATH